MKLGEKKVKNFEKKIFGMGEAQMKYNDFLNKIIELKNQKVYYNIFTKNCHIYKIRVKEIIFGNPSLGKWLIDDADAFR